jgi:hypothetical protein
MKRGASLALASEAVAVPEIAKTNATTAQRRRIAGSFLLDQEGPDDAAEPVSAALIARVIGFRALFARWP